MNAATAFEDLTAFPPAASAKTPMMKQYLSFKEQHPESILFFRMGDFYEMFFADAEIVSRVLGLRLTSRSKGAEKQPMAGIPHHAADRYLPQLIEAGFRVAICEQVQDPSEVKAGQVVKRAIVDIVTPGTITDERLLPQDTPNYLLTIVRQRNVLGLAWLDISTGRFFVMDIPGSVNALRGEIQRIQPNEILVVDKVLMAGGKQGPSHRDAIKNDIELSHAVEGLRGETMLSTVPDWTANRKTALEELREHFEVKSLKGFGVSEESVGVVAAGALLNYAERMKGGQLGKVRPPLLFQRDRFVKLDGATLRCLEIVSAMRSGEHADTLFGTLNNTRTRMGSRLLRDWLLAPLLDKDAIEQRYNCVSILQEDSFGLANLREQLVGIYDLERLAQKISSGRVDARDLAHLRDSLERLPALVSTCSALIESSTHEIAGLQKLITQIGNHSELFDLLKRALTENPSPTPSTKGEIFAPGFDPELDKFREYMGGSEAFQNQMAAKLREQLEIPTLKVGYNQVHGFYIEVTNANKHKVPEHFKRRQTLKNAERYITTELKEHEERILSAEDEIFRLENECFQRLKAHIAGAARSLQASSTALAKLDVFASFADTATSRGYVRPKLRDDKVIRILAGRHPVLDAKIQDEPFVPNDFQIGSDELGQINIITGPNMAGKSTFIRQVAVLVLMAQSGCFLPAESAEIGLVDRIFTRIGSADELARGLSTFMVEMVETANILNNASDRSLVVLDEVGRGTSTYDGVSIAWAMTEFIFDKLKARTLFATHYHELTALSAKRPAIRNYNVAVKEWQDEIIFLRKIVEGGADKSYGIHVARLAGVPKTVIQRAKKILVQLEDGSFEAQNDPLAPPPPVKTQSGQHQQLSLFSAAPDPVHEALKELDLHNLTPIQALIKLEELKKLV